MDTCAHCHRPIDKDKGFFIDRKTGMTMHATCFLSGIGLRRPAPVVRPLTQPVVAEKPERLAA
jgi:hypothetical protein